MAFTKPIPLTETELLLVIKDHYTKYINGDTKRIHYTGHGEERRDQADRNMSPEKVNQILRLPKRMVGEPRWSDRDKQWSYKVQGYNKREVVVTISHGYIDIITTY